eukprot:PLAT9078.1.p1 GENE.PLAT9078.1~~PLAT9078.1.p1  ORF type:complete len:633 (-),score=194.13 PLAT9078.1:61-1815(-)
MPEVESVDAKGRAMIIRGVAFRGGELHVSYARERGAAWKWKALSASLGERAITDVLSLCREVCDQAERLRDELACAPASPSLFTLPFELLGNVLDYLNSKDALAVACTASQACTAVPRSLRSLTYGHWGPFERKKLATSPALEAFHLVNSRDGLDVALPTLLDHCPRLRALTLSGRQKGDDLDRNFAPLPWVLKALPQFPGLQEVNLRGMALTADLGSCLASCKALQKVTLEHDQDGHRQHIPRFLEALRGCSQLQQLCGLHLADHTHVLDATFAAWPQLHQLELWLDEWRAAELMAALADGCPSLRQLRLRARASLTAEDAAALARMGELRELHMSEFELCNDFFLLLPSLKLLKLLSIERCRAWEDAWAALPAAVAALPLCTLRYVAVKEHGLPSAVFPALCEAVAAHGALRSVHCYLANSRWLSRDRELAMPALAQAFCSSPVLDWQIVIPLGDALFLQHWAARKPAAAVRSLQLPMYKSSAVLSGWPDTACLLQCVRSCPSLREMQVRLDKLEVSEVEQLIEAVRAEPLWPSRLRAVVARQAFTKLVAGHEHELFKLGLQLDRYPPSDEDFEWEEWLYLR